MEHISFLRTVFLVFLFQIHGSSAVTHVFVQKGNDVPLEVPESFVLAKKDTLFWKFNNNDNIVRFIPGTEPTIFDNYVERVSVKNYSVKLKNLQAADSGVYEARVIGDEDQTLAEYNVTVQDPVSPVGLKVDSVSTSSDSCIVNATCSTADSDISSSFTCVNQTCFQDGGEQSKLSNSGASLRIYLLNVTIICNHSNQISWTKNMIEIQPLCLKTPVLKTSSISVGLPIGIVAFLILAGIIFVVVRRQKKRKYDRENAENTVYATPEIGMTQTRAESPPSDASCASPTSTYSLVGPHRLNEQRSNPLPESLYAQVEKPARNLQEL